MTARMPDGNSPPPDALIRAFHAFPDAAALFGPTGSLLLCNALWRGVMADPAGVAWHARVPWADGADARRLAEALAREGRVREFAFPFLSGSGERGYGLLWTEPLELAAGTHTLVVVRDVTAERQALARWTESEEKFALLSEASFEGVLVHHGGRVLEVNASLARMFGYTPGEMIGMDGFLLTVPEDRPRLAAHIRSGDSSPLRGTALRKDGSTFPGELHGRSFTFRGRTLRVVAFRDITEQLRMERELVRRATPAARGLPTGTPAPPAR